MTRKMESRECLVKRYVRYERRLKIVHKQPRKVERKKKHLKTAQSSKIAVLCPTRPTTVWKVFDKKDRITTVKIQIERASGHESQKSFSISLPYLHTIANAKMIKYTKIEKPHHIFTIRILLLVDSFFIPFHSYSFINTTPSIKPNQVKSIQQSTPLPIKSKIKPNRTHTIPVTLSIPRQITKRSPHRRPN
jgi:hypothetical protein